jgi:hypothetical protein
MIKAQILSHRPFNINDQTRYLLVVNIKNKPHAFIRSYKNKPIFTENLYDCKTYNDYQSLGKIIDIFEGYEYRVCQVKDLFEMRYQVKYVKKDMFIEPGIESKRVWSLLTTPKPNTYSDGIKAQDELNKYKCRLLEYYHDKIMELSNISLDK